jgi:hypothetical protein
MASMELTAEQAAEAMAPEPYTQRWAVCETYLSKEALEAMGITDPMKPGTMVRLMGVACVTASSLDMEGEKADGMSLQITDLEVRPEAASAKSMFPKSKMEE